jgi:hypothetical protein
LAARGGATRQRQLPWVALGVALVAGCALGFALWTQSQSQRTPVLVVDRDLGAGEVLTAGDLRTVRIGADTGAPMVAVAEQDLVVGRAVRAPVPEGTPVQAAMLVDPDEVVPAGSAVVGVALQPGQVPVPTLREGATVQVVRTPPSGTEQDSAVLGEATVFAVTDTGEVNPGGLVVSLLVPAEAAEPVAAAAAQDAVRLALVGTGP